MTKRDRGDRTPSPRYRWLGVMRERVPCAHAPPCRCDVARILAGSPVLRELTTTAVVLHELGVMNA